MSDDRRGCLLFGTKIAEDSAKSLVMMNDPASAILGLHAQQNGLLPTKDYLAGFQQLLTPQDLYGEQWLLAYEANVKGRLSPLEGVDNVAGDPLFSILKNNRVCFYDESKVKEAFAEAPKLVAEEEPEEETAEAGYPG